MSDSNLEVYFEALKRLKDNRPINMPVGTKINNDTVSLEAGRKRGSIKKSREVFDFLIEEINNAKTEPYKNEVMLKEKVDKYKKLYLKYKEYYEQVLVRELMLIERLKELEKEI
ncbi:hypothetical protein [Aliarcobacter butzleri]|uniref:hypothetical protein n=1 Tax=Aliarcobacter butzleri TaxID=28197 RepID=UPI000229595E|nr:hypothetical protein [Aliarcobacter butzleri]BAK71263.1 hypothetical protein ABED_1546 [Aliarcobacter butzleri ED-1]